MACEAFPDVVLRVADLLPAAGHGALHGAGAGRERAADDRERGRGLER